MRMHRSAATAASLTIAALLLAACGGGTAATPDGTGAPVATPAPTQAGGSVAPTAAPPAGEASAPAFAIPSFDLSQLGGAIPGLDSYRVAVSTDGKKQYESVVVTQPEVAKHITTFKDDGSPDSEFILIGKQAWQSDGSGGWQEIPSTLAQGMLLAFDPTVLFGAYANANWTSGAGDKGVEDKNGIQAHHFSIDPGTFVGAPIPAGTSVDLWVADAGYLVALEIVGDGGKGITIGLSNVNDPSNKVETPS